MLVQSASLLALLINSDDFAGPGKGSDRCFLHGRGPGGQGLLKSLVLKSCLIAGGAAQGGTQNRPGRVAEAAAARCAVARRSHGTPPTSVTRTGSPFSKASSSAMGALRGTAEGATPWLVTCSAVSAVSREAQPELVASEEVVSQLGRREERGCRATLNAGLAAACGRAVMVGNAWLEKSFQLMRGRETRHSLQSNSPGRAFIPADPMKAAFICATLWPGSLPWHGPRAA